MAIGTVAGNVTGGVVGGAAVAGTAAAVGSSGGGLLTDFLTDSAKAIGGDWVAGFTERIFHHWWKVWFGDGLLNYDITQALAQALHGAIGDLRSQWQQENYYKGLRHRAPDTARLTLDALNILDRYAAMQFDMLMQLTKRPDAHQILTHYANREYGALKQLAATDTQARGFIGPEPDKGDLLVLLLQEKNVAALLQRDDSALRAEIEQIVVRFFVDCDDQEFVRYVRKYLANWWILHFVNILKSPDEAGSRAWRACQMLWQRSLSRALDEVNNNTRAIQETVAWLHAWAERLEQFPAIQRDDTGMAELDAVIALMGERLAAIKTDTEAIRRDTAAIKQGVQAILDRSQAAPVPLPPEPSRPPGIPGFVGRVRDLAQFAHALQLSGLAVIAGMAGVGKTAVAAALAQQHGDPTKVFWHTFRQGEGVDVLIWKIAGFLAWYQRSDSLWQLLHAGGKQPPVDVTLDYLLRLIHGQDYLLCFDDFHHVDEDPLLETLLERLRLATATREISIIITSRRIPDFIPLAKHKPLGGLTMADTRSLLAKRGVRLRKDLLEKLVARTEGNAELLTLTVDALDNTEDRRSLLDNLVKADDIERYLLNTVDRGLQDDERQVMNGVAALLGYPGTRSAIEEVLGGIGVRRQLAYLTNRYLLRLEGKLEREYGQHPIVQAFYYDLLSRRERQELHRRAGEYYEHTEDDAFKAAMHLAYGGDNAHAAQLATKDTWRLINRGQASALRLLLERFEAQQLTADLWAKVNIAHGLASSFLGQRDVARARYDVAIAVTAQLTDAPADRILKAQACRGMGELLELENPQEALEWFQRGLAELAQADLLEHAAINIGMGTVQMYLGDHKSALRALEVGLQSLPDGSNYLRSAALKSLSAVYLYLGDIQAAEQNARAAVAATRNLHAYFEEASMHVNLGSIHYISGKWQDAIADYERALKMSRDLSNVEIQMAAGLNLGITYIRTGDDIDSFKSLRNTLDLARNQRLHVFEAFAQFSLADLEIRSGQWDEAARSLRAAEELADDLGHKSLLTAIYSAWAELNIATGQQQAAIAAAERSVQLAQETGETVDEGIGLRVLGDALQAGDRPEEALQVLAQSVALLDKNDPYEAARTQVRMGLALQRVGDTSRGLAMLVEATATFRRLGAKRDLALAERILERR